MEGLYRFKTGFGGEIHHRLGCWDYPMKGLSYGVFRLGEGLRNWYYKTFKKR
jgi:lipid II:glycine glycyltransferase (peptidoglycan interpeptide bridge formation enzyme)